MKKILLLMVAISLIGGNALAKDESGRANSSSYAFTPVHRPAVEVYDVLWCGWSPRAIVAMQLMKEKYPDDFICITYHPSDLMHTIYGDNEPADVSSYPTAYLDRKDSLDPYYGSGNTDLGIEDDWLERRETIAPADVEVAGVLSADGSYVDITANFTFAIDNDEANYEAELILLVDSLHGEGTRWSQTNYYTGYSFPYDEFDVFTEGGSHIYGLYFNDVILTTSRISDEGNPTLPSSIEASQEIEISFTQPISDITKYNDHSDFFYALSKNVNNLKVVALLIDKSTGIVVNANKSNVDVSKAENGLPLGMENEKRVVIGDYAYILYDTTHEAAVNGLASYSTTSIEIPDTVTYEGEEYEVTSLADECFQKYDDIKSATIPSSVTTLGVRCFYHCDSLVSVDLPSSITSLPDSCFYYCTSLSSIDIPSPVTSIGARCFRSCTSLSSVTLPASVTTLDSYCFSYCTSLSEITCYATTPPDIYSSTFYNTDISSCTLYVPAVAYLEYKNNSVEYWTEFHIVAMDDDEAGIVTIDGFTYNLDSSSAEATLLGIVSNEVISVEIPETITYNGSEYTIVALADGCFRNNANVVSVDIPSTVSSLGSYCFYNCASLTNVQLPSSITSIGFFCFGYSSVESIEIPSSVTSLGNYCFSNCTSLTSVRLSASITSLSMWCFNGCDQLTNVEIESPLTSLGYGCFGMCESLTSIEIPSTVTSLDDQCFVSCINLRDIVLPDSLTLIGDYCFEFCQSLTSIDIPSSVTYLGFGCFEWCESLVDINLPSSLSYLPGVCFYLCTSLADIEIPASIDSLGYKTFAYCTSLKEITCHAPNPPLLCDSATFVDVDKDSCTLYVPLEAVDIYKATEVWKDFYIVAIDESAGIDTVELQDMMVSVHGGELTITGVDDGTTAVFYSIDGKVLGNAKSVGGSVRIELPAGVVIAKIGNRTIKIAMK